MSKGVYGAILKGKQVPKKKRNRDDFAAYRLKAKGVCALSVLTNPLTGKREERIAVEGYGEKKDYSLNVQ